MTLPYVALSLAGLLVTAAGCGGRTEMTLSFHASGTGGTTGLGGASGGGGLGGANGGGAYPQAGGAYPQAGGAFPQAGGAFPQTGGAYPQAGGAFPQTGGAYPQAGSAAGTTQTGTCSSVCAMILATCPIADPTCETGCEEQRLMYPQCNPELDVFIGCVERNGVRCRNDGSVTVRGCTAEGDAMDLCLYSMPPTPTPVPVPAACAAFPPPPPSSPCTGAGMGAAGGAGTTSVPACTTSCYAAGMTWTSTCQGGKCACSFDGMVVCTCANDPAMCVSCCPGL
jgi:hypothetical protein